MIYTNQPARPLIIGDAPDGEHTLPENVKVADDGRLYYDATVGRRYMYAEQLGKKTVITYRGKLKLPEDRSKYMPHQGIQEAFRRDVRPGWAIPDSVYKRLFAGRFDRDGPSHTVYKL